MYPLPINYRAVQIIPPQHYQMSKRFSSQQPTETTPLVLVTCMCLHACRSLTVVLKQIFSNLVQWSSYKWLLVMALIFLHYLEFKKHLTVTIKNYTGTLLIRYIKQGVPPFSANTNRSLAGFLRKGWNARLHLITYSCSSLEWLLILTLWIKFIDINSFLAFYESLYYLNRYFTFGKKKAQTSQQ